MVLASFEARKVVEMFILTLLVVLIPKITLKNTVSYILTDRSHHRVGRSISFVLKKFNLEFNSRIGHTENLGV